MKYSKPPRVITHVDGDSFMVVGEERIYEDPVDAIRRARQKGKGSQAIRLSDGKVIAEVPGHTPPPPKDYL